MKNKTIIRNNQFGFKNSSNTKASLIKKSYIVVTLLLLIVLGRAQTKGESILGNYMVPSKDGAITIYEKEGKYYGKIILNKDPNKLDVNNPDKEKQKQKTLGLNILNGFVFDGTDTWKSGTIYDPKNGKTYSCKITANENGDLNIRGYIGVSVLGRTEIFAKLKN